MTIIPVTLQTFSQWLTRFSLVALTIVFSASCGGGGGSDSGGGSITGEGETYRVQAAIQSDSCGERISNVDQPFTISSGGSVINTTLLNLAATRSGSELKGEFTETNGDCTRRYEVVFTNVSATSLTASLTSSSQCGPVSCESRWQGIGLRDDTAGVLKTIPDQTAANELSPESSVNHVMETNLKIRGEACNANVPTTVGFRPSLFECNGNSAVLLQGALRDNFSVVVRRDGQFNDRDPNNPTCGTNRCSPYKTQKKIELAQYQTNCLGGSGYSADYVPVNRISIKFTAVVTNPSDTNQFEQYCLTSTTSDLN